MAQRIGVSRGARLGGGLLVCFGGVGIAAGVVPLAASAARMLGADLRGTPDLALHGIESMGMSLPWAALSSWDGTFLGGLLVAAGIGWMRGRAWAPLVTFLYAADGVMVTGIDLLSFAAVGRPGPMRAAMLALDGVAFALAVAILIAVLLWWRRWRRGHYTLEAARPSC